jgi:hypothetical protein
MVQSILVSDRRPNKRVQRTRLRSPLTRHPLGSPNSHLCAILVVFLTSWIACTSSPPPQNAGLQGPALCTCRPAAPETSSVAVLSIEATGSDGRNLPGVHVSLAGPLREGRESIRWTTGGDHPLAQALAPGSWEVNAASPGFLARSAGVTLKPGESCTLSFRMEVEWHYSEPLITY